MPGKTDKKISQEKNGILYLVPTPIGNLGDMTYRGVEILKTVDIIAAEDTRTSKVLLNHYGIKNKLVSYHKFNEAKKTAALILNLHNGQNVAVITDAGTPGISDPAAILIRTAIENGIQVSCLPGATALIPALAASGLDTEVFTYAGFLPPKQKERKKLLSMLALIPHSIILYESSHNITSTLSELKEYFKNRQTVIAKEISKLHETFYRGNLEALSESEELDTRGEFVILIKGRQAEQTDDTILEALLWQGLNAGIQMKELVSQVMEKTGLNRNKIYKMALKLKQGDVKQK
jgi:16S rRNA (cytidine1402-2'-O)-methyltransferase